MKNLTKLNNARCLDKFYQTELDKAKKIYPCIKLINYCCGCCLYPESAQECCWKNYQQFDLSKVLNPFGRTQANMCCICLWNNYPNEHTCGYLEREKTQYMSCCWLEKKELKKNMKKTTNQKTKNQVIIVPTGKKAAPKTKKTKSSAVDYYNCLLTSAQNNWFDPVLGKKQKITQCCKNCKLQAPALNESRNQEIKKLVISYQQVGDSLKKLLQPIK